MFSIKPEPKSSWRFSSDCGVSITRHTAASTAEIADVEGGGDEIIGTGQGKIGSEAGFGMKTHLVLAISIDWKIVSHDPLYHLQNVICMYKT
jgi:hypothetical protein